MIGFYTFLLILYLLTYKIKKIRNKLSAHLFWNSLLVLFMEMYMETALLSMLNLSSLEWPEQSLFVASNVLAIFFFALVIVIPIFITVFHCKRIECW